MNSHIIIPFVGMFLVTYININKYQCLLVSSIKNNAGVKKIPQDLV